MKQHMIAFGGAAQDYSAGLVTVPFIADGLIRASSNVVQLTEDWQILYGYAGGSGMLRLRLSAASLRLRGYPNLVPFMDSHLGGDNPAMLDFRDDPLRLLSGENVTLQATNGGAQAAIVLLQICRGEPNFNVNASRLRLIRFTASAPSLAYGWGTESNIVLDDELEQGMYDVYGLQLYEADCIAGRLVFKDQVERPGAIGQQAAANRPAPWTMGEIGLLGSFNPITPPFIQVLHVAAATQSITGYMLVARR